MATTYLINDDWMDSMLMPGGTSAVAELTITIKVYLARHPARQITYNNEDGGTTTVQTQNWEGPRAASWAQDLKRVVEEGWNDKLWLVPSRDWRFDTPPVRDRNYRVPCIKCKLQIQYVGREAAHLVINCYHIDPDQFVRSSMSAPYLGSFRRCSLRGGEVFGTLDTNDIRPKRSGQISALHEFGHYIGLGHVNQQGAVRAGRGSNSTLAYGGNGHQRSDLMGAGTRIEGWHGYPWCRRLRRHLGGNQPGGTSWHYVRGSTPTWETGAGTDQVFWDVTRQQRNHVTIDYMDLYGHRTDWRQANMS